MLERSEEGDEKKTGTEDKSKEYEWNHAGGRECNQA